jgi:hypothetical protein
MDKYTNRFDRLKENLRDFAEPIAVGAAVLACVAGFFAIKENAIDPTNEDMTAAAIAEFGSDSEIDLPNINDGEGLVVVRDNGAECGATFVGTGNVPIVDIPTGAKQVTEWVCDQDQPPETP